jgi:hypothetical protein
MIFVLFVTHNGMSRLKVNESVLDTFSERTVHNAPANAM